MSSKVVTQARSQGGFSGVACTPPLKLMINQENLCLSKVLTLTHKHLATLPLSSEVRITVLKMSNAAILHHSVERSDAFLANGPYAKLFFDITHTARLIYKRVRLISRIAQVGYFAKAAKIPELCHKIVVFYKHWPALSGVPRVLQQPPSKSKN